jgi:outer membrane protein assembly factor BamB
MVAALYGENSVGTQQAAQPSLFPLRAAWTLELNNALTASPAFNRETAYFPIEGNRLAAYDLITGTQRWIVDAPVNTEPIAGDGLLFVAEPGALVARREADGSVQWRQAFDALLAVPLFWKNQWLLAADASGTLTAYRSVDGRQLWRQSLSVPAHDRITLDGDRLYVPTADARVVALQLETGALLWERRLGGPAHEVLAVDDRLYVGSNDNFFYCLDGDTGNVVWRWRTGGDVIGLAAADDRRVYFVSLDNVLRALDRRSGSQIWKRAVPFRPIAGPRWAADVLVVTGHSPTARAFLPRDGMPAGEITVSGEFAVPPYVVHGSRTLTPRVIAVTRDIAKGAIAVALDRSPEPELLPTISLPTALPSIGAPTQP